MVVNDKYLSVVVPVYNEENSIAELHAEILAMWKDMNLHRSDGSDPADEYSGLEIIFVDDRSTDKAEAVCRLLSPLKYVRFAANAGQTAAMDCGFHLAKGKYIAALDADGQNDPADIPQMLEILTANNYDAVSGWRKHRKDTLSKRVMSFGAYLLRRMLLHDVVHDSGCTLKVYRRECFAGFYLYNDQHRFIPALLKRRGFSIGECVVRHRERKAGKSKYGASRVFKGINDLLEIRKNEDIFSLQSVPSGVYTVEEVAEW